jgi:hypothetical protein
MSWEDDDYRDLDDDAPDALVDQCLCGAWKDTRYTRCDDCDQNSKEPEAA